MEDTAYLTLDFSNRDGGVPLIAARSMDFVRHNTTRTSTAIGETGTLRWNAIAGTVDRFGKDGGAWETMFTHRHGRDDSYVAEWREFLARIADGGSPAISGQDGLTVLQIIEAARVSSSTGAVTPIARG